MKLLNRSLRYLSLAFFFIIGIWSVIFYINLKDEIRDSIDDGLENNRLLILQKIATDSTLFSQNEYGGNNFEIHYLSKKEGLAFTDIYKDTMMYRLNEDDLEPVRVLKTAFEHQNNYYQLNIISSLVEEDDLIEDSFYSILLLFILLITSVIIINNLILKKVWNPFYDILNQLKNYRLDKEEPLLNIATKTSEFVQLQDASNILIQHSKETFASQKQFTENASHELQTPVAIILNKLELLLESENLIDKDAATIAEVIKIAERLTKLNKSLLLLAKIENKQFSDEEIISVSAVIDELLPNYQDLADYKNISIQYSKNSELQVVMNKSLLEILISNLLKNAIFHNQKEGEITIELNTEFLKISNSGKAISLNAKTIFNRFVKEDTTNLTTGLGLAICKTICESYGFQIQYLFENNAHSFYIYFKKNQ